jgi:hypothetical protein
VKNRHATIAVMMAPKYGKMLGVPAYLKNQWEEADDVE